MSERAENFVQNLFKLIQKHFGLLILHFGFKIFTCGSQILPLTYFRLFPAFLQYEADPSVTAVDNLLDSVTSLLWAQPKDRQPILRPLAVNLARMEYLCSNKFGIADLALFSALKQLNLEK